MKTSESGIALIKKWEGCRLKAYPDPATGGDPWTIGYGLTTAAGIIKVTRGLTITQAQADQYLVRSLIKYEAAVINSLTRSPTQPQFDAMVSLCYNIGPGAFARSSVVKRFNKGDILGAADAFRLWNKAGGKVLQGLTKRREDERSRFLAPVAVEPSPPPMPDPEPVSPETTPRRSFWSWLKALFSGDQNA